MSKVTKDRGVKQRLKGKRREKQKPQIYFTTEIKIHYASSVYCKHPELKSLCPHRSFFSNVEVKEGSSSFIFPPLFMPFLLSTYTKSTFIKGPVWAPVALCSVTWLHIEHTDFSFPLFFINSFGTYCTVTLSTTLTLYSMWSLTNTVSTEVL